MYLLEGLKPLTTEISQAFTKRKNGKVHTSQFVLFATSPIKNLRMSQSYQRLASFCTKRLKSHS